MEEILASIRKIIADDEAAGAAPLDPRAPVDTPMALETESLEAAFGREPFFESARRASAASQQPAQQVTGAPHLAPVEDIMELSEDFLVAEGDLDNPLSAPGPFQSDPHHPASRTGNRVEPQLSTPAYGRQFTPSPFPELPTGAQRANIEAELHAGERRLWDGQPPIALRTPKSEPAQPQLSSSSPHMDTPKAAQQTSASAGADAAPRAKPADQPASRPPSRQGWAGPRDLGRNAAGASDAARARPVNGLENGAGEPFWAQPDIDQQPVNASSRPQTQRRDQPAQKEPSLHVAPAPPASPRMDNTPAHSRLSAPVTHAGSAAVSMPQLPESPEDGPISAIPEDETDGRPQYFQTMAEELVRATISGLADRELSTLNAKKMGDVRPELRSVAESFAETMSHGAFRSDASSGAGRMSQGHATARSATPSALTMKATGAHAPELVKQSQGPSSQGSLEEGFKELLKPMLMDWLNENMPRLLESAVQQELERRSGGKHD